MPRRNWNQVQPTSITHAIELCTSYAREKRNLSVERIAELMGMASHHSLYKWMAEGRMPLNMLRPFEHACGANYVSKYIAHSARLLTMPIPSGRKADARDVNSLQASLTEAVSVLIDFYEGKSSAPSCVGPVVTAMENLGWHKANVDKSDQPDLQLFEDEES
ncbi:MAG: hypothetical protein R3332_08410 [Pseudohongiellaceae bacterium]|nr:hypothetical protein [Pseudohongiellaceae bacterium]